MSNREELQYLIVVDILERMYRAKLISAQELKRMKSVAKQKIQYQTSAA